MQRAARLLSEPRSAQETAAEAAAFTLSLPKGAKNRVTAARILFGTTAIAVAVTIPDLAVGAMDSPYLRIDVREPTKVLDQPIWSPAAGATAPVFASAMAAETIAPSSLTFSNLANASDEDRMKLLGFLETGSERFDLAFVGVEMPSPVQFTNSEGFPSEKHPEFGAAVAPLRARLIDVPQITSSRSFTPSLSSDVRRAGASLSRESSVERSVAAANESLTAAFAGVLDITGDITGNASGGVRDVLPIQSADRTSSSDTVAPQADFAVPLPSPPSGLGASREAQVELVDKTQLDARVNGVVTGSVDFEQQNGTIAIRLGSIVDLLRDRFTPSEIDRISGAGALGSYISLAELQAAGIPINYDPVYDEMEFGIDYDDAPQAAKVQMEQIGGPTLGSDGTLIDQISR